MRIVHLRVKHFLNLFCADWLKRNSAVRYCSVMTDKPAETPAERVRARMRQWLDVTGLTQEEFALSMEKGQEWLSAILKGKNDPRLRDLDLIADAMRTSAAELVRATSDRYQLELTPTEVRILEKLRRKPEILEGLVLLLEVRPPTPRNRMSVSNSETTESDKDTQTLRLRHGE